MFLNYWLYGTLFPMEDFCTYVSFTKTNNRQKTTIRVSLVTFQAKLIIGCQYTKR